MDRFIKIAEIIEKKMVLIKIIGACFLVAYCVYMWYTFVYIEDFDSDQREAYLSAKKQEVVFEQKKFENILDNVEKRKTNFDQKINISPDIFGIKN